MSMNINPNLVKLNLPLTTVGASSTEPVEVDLQEITLEKDDTTLESDLILEHMVATAINNGVNTQAANTSANNSALKALLESFKNGDLSPENFVKEIIKQGAENVVMLTNGTRPHPVSVKFDLGGVSTTAVGKEQLYSPYGYFPWDDNNSVEIYFDKSGNKSIAKEYEQDGTLFKEAFFSPTGHSCDIIYSNYCNDYLNAVLTNNDGRLYGLPPETTSITYPNGSRLEVTNINDAEGRTLFSVKKMFDKEGRLTSVKEVDNNYEYNLFRKIVYKGKTELTNYWNYDANGNLVHEGYSKHAYNKDNELRADSSDEYSEDTEYKYNSSGNLIEKCYKDSNGFLNIEKYDDYCREIYCQRGYADGSVSIYESVYSNNSAYASKKSYKKTEIEPDGKKTETTTEYLEDGTKTVNLKVTDVNGKVVTDVIETYNAAGKLISRVDNSKALINLTSDEFDGYGDGSFVEAGSYTKNSYSGESNVRANAVKNVKEFIDQLSAGIAGKDKYDKAALNYAKNMTKEFFEKVINAMSAHSGVSNGEWTGKTGSINLSDGTTFNSISYNQESHQGYIDAKKNGYDGDNLQWTRGTMAGARFAKITIKADYIIDMFIQFYNSYAAKN